MKKRKTLCFSHFQCWKSLHKLGRKKKPTKILTWELEYILYFDNIYLNLKLSYLISIKGDIVGGIVGTDIIRYDIYGNDVYIANKMESNGKPGFVNVSERTRSILSTKFEEEFEFEENGPIFISNTGENIPSFFITKK